MDWPEREYKFETRHEYPHMLPRDAVIWERFIIKNPDRFISCLYDLHVGDGAKPEDDTPPGTAYAWTRLTQWRADVAAWDGQTLFIIEVKPDAKASAVGQALGYKILAQDNLKLAIPIIPVVLTDICAAETERFAKAVGVEVWCA